MQFLFQVFYHLIRFYELLVTLRSELLLNFIHAHRGLDSLSLLPEEERRHSFLVAASSLGDRTDDRSRSITAD